jgi:hypothetical protein
MTKKDRVGPVVLMFIAAGLSFLICEQLSKDKAPQLAASIAQEAPLAQTSVAALIPAEKPRNFAQRIVQKVNHIVHSSAHSAELLESSAIRESGFKTVQPETASADELGDVSIAHGLLDLGLQPSVIVLPEKQVPLASAGLYDKRTHQKL